MRDQEILGLMNAYASVYANISESHFKVGDEVICKKSGMEGEIVKVDPEEKGKYYTVKREDGKMVKYAPDELKLEKEEEEEEKDEKEDMKEAKNGGATKKAETRFHTKLDKLVHKTFGSSPEEKKMKEEVELDEASPTNPNLYTGRHGQTSKQYQDSRSPGGKMVSGDSGQSGASWSHRSFRGSGGPVEPGVRQPAQGRMDTKTRADVEYRKTLLKNRSGGGSSLPGVGTPSGTGRFIPGQGGRYGISGIGLADSYDYYDIVLSHLLAEGYADTNEAALAIMANMSEEWRKSIVENRGMSHSGGKSGASGDGSRPKGITGGKTYQMPGWNDKKKAKEV